MARYQYETSPRKIEPDYQKPRTRKKKKVVSQKNKELKKQIQKRAKENVRQKHEAKIRKRKIILSVLVVFGILFAISYRNSLINESFSKVKNLKTELASLEKENEQLQVSIESSTNLQNVEQAAKEQLGMQKLTNDQKVYINLSKKDYVEPASESVIMETNENWFQKIWNKIMGK